MGCRGVRVTDPAALGPALREALAARAPTVIDVMTSLEVTFADITSQLAKDASPRRR
jgi:acetolactate synthase-1/2/3 large subunit